MHRALTFLTATVTATAFLSAGCAGATAGAPPRAPSNVQEAPVSESDGPPAASPSETAPNGADATTEEPSKTHPVSDEAHGAAALPRAMGWFSLAFGASAGIVAIGTSFMMLHQHDLRNADCNSAKVCSQDGIDANNQLGGLAGWNVASYVTAAVGIGVGTILLVTTAKTKKETALEVSPANSGAALQLRGTF
jgi:hypothetical protein